jgi:polyisoprenoid-binding protein YceI
MRIHNIFFPILLFTLNSFAGTQYDLALQDTLVEFFAVGKPSLLKINGTGGKLRGQIEIDGNQFKGDYKVNLNDLTTGIDMRDHHMKEKYLETGKFPEASFKITKIALPVDFLKQKKAFTSVPFEGKMTIKGVEKDVNGTADIDCTSEPLIAKTEFKTQITPYGIDVPSYMGIKVADEVTIKTSMKLKK